MCVRENIRTLHYWDCGLGESAGALSLILILFLHTHSWLNWVDEDDEDEVGLKEKSEDTRYIKKITSK